MYSDSAQQLLDEHGAETGDRLRILHDGGEEQGTLMPRSDQGNTDAIVIKLDSGYNLGIDTDQINDIEVLDSGEQPEPDQPTVPDRDPDKPDIAVLHTGGTIASRVSYREGGVKPAFDPEDLLQMYPEIFDEANIDSDVIAQMLSEDMEPAHWQEIAAAVAERREDVDGIIIGHGTDTMQYTAAALSFMLEGLDIPVVLVGAQRSSDRPSSDAAMNLISAVEFIKEDIPGVFVCMHQHSSDDTAAVHRGTRVRKMHTSRRDAFQSIGAKPVATVDYDERSVTLHDEISGPDEAFSLRDELDTDVGLLKTHPGMDPDQVRRHEDRSGLIIEGTGLGHMPVNSFDDHTQHHDDILDAVDDLADDSLVAMASQTISGRVNMNVYDAGVKIRKAGVVPAANMPPETALVKLMWSLGQTGDPDTARDLFTQNVAGEIQDREEHDDYR
ncbi:MAG: Glu-tRNA(Gln) amidotransferase subunit GatD [Candidatus Nanohaloarchaea archaeon]|nr:Glu-tRNA(Gln) amidotransferase subunit GatD [Candidatus Nanohaloarchaea archaeon]